MGFNHTVLFPIPKHPCLTIASVLKDENESQKRLGTLKTHLYAGEMGRISIQKLAGDIPGVHLIILQAVLEGRDSDVGGGVQRSQASNCH